MPSSCSACALHPPDSGATAHCGRPPGGAQADGPRTVPSLEPLDQDGSPLKTFVRRRWTGAKWQSFSGMDFFRLGAVARRDHPLARACQRISYLRKMAIQTNRTINRRLRWRNASSGMPTGGCTGPGLSVKSFGEKRGVCWVVCGSHPMLATVGWVRWYLTGFRACLHGMLHAMSTLRYVRDQC